MNSQARVQHNINLHNQKKKWLVQIEWKWCGRLNKDKLKHKLHTTYNLWGEAPLLTL